MVTEKAATKQIRRLAVYGDYPRLRDEQVLPELRRALLNSGGTDERAERIVDAILAEPEREFCPKPGQIQAVARETSDQPEPATRREYCDKCDGTGWRQVEDTFTLHSEGVRLCDCRKAATK